MKAHEGLTPTVAGPSGNPWLRFACLSSGLVVAAVVVTTTAGGQTTSVGERGLRAGHLTAERPIELQAVHRQQISRKPKIHGVFDAPVQNFASADFSLSITSVNNYTQSTPVKSSRWPLLAEPHRLTTLKAACSGQCSRNAVYEWIVMDELLTGEVVQHEFKLTGRHAVTLTMLDGETGNVMAQEGFEVMVKYVRREIRALTDDDRNLFLDTLETLYRIPTTQGQAMYGANYKGVEYFVAKHLQGAGRPECDHWHDDAGIMTHHVGFTLEFEQALQVVSPSVSIPYWEYTKDAYVDPTLATSKIFQDDWLGELSPVNAHNTLTKGRWAYTPVAQGAWDEVHNPYGLLRSSWNTDPTPYITRHRTVANIVAAKTPDCFALKTCFAKGSISEMNNCLNGGTHGPVHIQIGGEWNHPDTAFLQDYNIDIGLVLGHKSLWRRGYARVPESCAGVAAADCKPSCPKDILTKHNMSAYDVLVDSSILDWSSVGGGRVYWEPATGQYRITGLEGDQEAATKVFEHMLEVYCNPGYVGEMFTSAAPYDPSFWLLHPSADRFLAWRRIVAGLPDTSRPLDETWGYDHSSEFSGGTIIGDMGVVCDWDNVEGTDLPKCTKGVCYGHGVNDTLPFEIKINGQALPAFTNAELYDWIHPYSEELPYMYDGYEWPWCDEQGYPMI